MDRRSALAAMASLSIISPIGGALAQATGAPRSAAVPARLTLGAAINKAGRQRMLSQRMAKAYAQMGLGLLPDRAFKIMNESMTLFDAHQTELAAFAPTADIAKTYAELARLQLELAGLRAERDKAQSVANTASTLLTSEKVTQERLTVQVKNLEADNRRLRDDLGFFEKLIPTTGVGGIAIRSLQAQVEQGRVVKWQVLVIQAVKDPVEFSGRLELSFVGVQNGKPWAAALPGGPQVFKLKQYGRLDGVFDLPPHAVIKEVSARVLDGSVTKAVQTVKL